MMSNPIVQIVVAFVLAGLGWYAQDKLLPKALGALAQVLIVVLLVLFILSALGVFGDHYKLFK